MLAGIWFALDNALGLVVALGLGVFCFGGREPWRPLFAALAFFPLVAVGAVALTAGLLTLTPPALTAVLAVLALPAAVLLWRRRGDTETRPAPAPGGAAEAGAGGRPGAADAGGLIALGLAGGLCAAWSFKSLVLGTRFEWDDLSYHAAIPTQWLLDGAISLVPLTYQAYYPMNSELFSLWFLLPLGADAHANLAVFWWGALAVASLAVLARALGASRTGVGLAVSLFLGSSVVWNRSNSFGATDLACAASLLAALAFLAPTRQARHPSAETASGVDTATALASGAMAGFAVGCKIFYAPAALLVGLAAAAGAGGGRRGRALVLFGAAAALTGSAWYLRNWLLTGNPVFPAEVGPFAGPFDAESRAHTTLIHHLSERPGDLSLWRHVVVTRLDWPPALALIAALGYLGARGGPRDDARRLRLLLAGVGVVLLALYPFLPFSATKNRPDIPLHVGYLRFAIAPFAIGAALFAARVRDGAPARGLWLAAGIVAVASAWKLPALSSLVAFLAGLALICARGPAERLAAAAIASPGRALAVASAALVLLAAWTPAKQALTDANVHTWHAQRAPIGDAWRALEALPPGSRVAFFMAEPFEYTQFHPIFGRRFQLRPVPVDAEGAPHRMLHDGGAREGGWWQAWEESETPLDPERFRRNLRAAGLDYVLVSRWSLGQWPRQQRALLASRRGERIYDDGYSVIWRVNGS